MQITCRNRAVGKSFACQLCSKSFPTKRHLHEHSKRKHPNTSSKPHSQIQFQEAPQISEPPQSFSTYDSSYYNYSNTSTTPSEDSYVKNELMVGHDLPLPQMSTNNNPSVMEEDHNVGSLLRLVYSCPDQLDHHHQTSQSEYIQQSQNTSSNTANNNDLMEYATAPILDGISLDYL